MVNPGVVELILQMYHEGCTILYIARTLNLHIEDVVNIINEYH